MQRVVFGGSVSSDDVLDIVLYESLLHEMMREVR